MTVIAPVVAIAADATLIPPTTLNSLRSRSPHVLHACNTWGDLDRNELSVVGGINVASAAIATTGAITVTGAATVDGATYVLNPVALNGSLVWTSSGTCLTTYNYC